MDGTRISAILIGREVQAIRSDHAWTFDFGDGFTIVTQCLWRLVDPTGVILTNEDDGHQFGFPAPIDAQHDLNARLAGQTMKRCICDGRTGDMQIGFGADLMLDILSTSGGYESWQANLGDMLVVGRGDGLILFEGVK